MIQALITLIGVLPELLKLINSFVAYLNSVSGNDPKTLLNDLGTVFDELSQAKSQDDRYKAAGHLADLFAGISKL